MDKTAHNRRDIQLIKLTSKDSTQWSWYASEWLLSVLRSSMGHPTHNTWLWLAMIVLTVPTMLWMDSHMQSKYIHTHELLVWLCQAALENIKIACLCVCLYVSIMWLRIEATFILMSGTCRPCIKKKPFSFFLYLYSALHFLHKQKQNSHGKKQQSTE